MIKPYNRPYGREGNKPTALAGDKNAPLLVLTHHLSPGGGTFPAAKY